MKIRIMTMFTGQEGALTPLLPEITSNTKPIIKKPMEMIKLSLYPHGFSHNFFLLFSIIS
jgi:hypothetical protein